MRIELTVIQISFRVEPLFVVNKDIMNTSFHCAHWREGDINYATRPVFSSGHFLSYQFHIS